MPRAPRASKATVCSIGYGGHTTGSFVATLRDAGVDTLVDIRARPVSRKKGFSKNVLRGHLEAAGLSYVGMPQLGAPKDLRDAYHASHDVVAFHQAYGHHLDVHPEAVDQVASLAQRRKVALMCLERDANDCHRAILEERLAADGYAIVHLEGQPDDADGDEA